MLQQQQTRTNSRGEAYVIGPTGAPLTLNDLPPVDTGRWVIRRKAEVVAAVRGGLLTLDEASYSPGGGAMGADHPIAWARSVGAGRAFYTGLGHRIETFADTRFLAHLGGAIVWSAQRDVEWTFADGFEAQTQGILTAQ